MKSITDKQLLSILIFFLGLLFFAGLVNTVLAESFDFSQTDWSGGTSTSTATHPGDQTGWTNFDSSSSSIDISTAGQLSVASTTASSTDTTYADFDEGTNSSTSIVGVGAEGSIELQADGSWDISKSSFSASTTAQDTSPEGLAWKTDGTKFYEVGQSSDKIYEYDVSTPWDITTLSFSTSTDTRDSVPLDITWKPDGKKFYEIGSDGDKIYEYDVSDPWDISTLSFRTSFRVEGSFTTPPDFAWKIDGTKVYNLEAGFAKIHEYDVSDPWDVSTASLNDTTSITEGASSTPHGITWRPDGAKLYLADDTNLAIYEYDVSDPWDASTLSLNNSVSVKGSSTRSIAWKSDGTKFYDIDDASDPCCDAKIHEYSINTTSTNSGTYTSTSTDTGQKSNFTTLDFTANTNSSTTLTVDVRAGNTATPDGSWTAWQTDISDGGSLGALDGNRYFQYRANLSTTDTDFTPSLDDIVVNYFHLPSSSQHLTFSYYDTSDDSASISSISWSETLNGGDVQFRLRTAPDSSGSPGSATSFCGPDNGGASCDNTTFFSDPSGDETVDTLFSDQSDDRWVQLRAFLTASSTFEGVPTLSDITLAYALPDSGSGGEPSSDPPLPPLSASINSNTTTTTSTVVNLILQTGGHTEWAEISNDESFKNSKTVSFQGVRSPGFYVYEDVVEWNLCYPDTECPEGTYKVYVKFKSFDDVWSSSISDSIKYVEASKTGEEDKEAQDSLEDDKDEDDKKSNTEKKKEETTAQDSGTTQKTNLTDDQINSVLGVLKSFNVNESTIDKVKETLLGLPAADRETKPEPQYNFNQNLRLGDEGPDVKELQKLLDIENCFNFPRYTNYFGPITENGVICLQEKYASQILTPLNIVEGTGYFATSTRSFANNL